MTTHIRLELRPDGDGFAGRATSDTESREFHGWLGLMGAIAALYPGAGEAALARPQVGLTIKTRARNTRG